MTSASTARRCELSTRVECPRDKLRAAPHTSVLPLVRFFWRGQTTASGPCHHGAVDSHHTTTTTTVSSQRHGSTRCTVFPILGGLTLPVQTFPIFHSFQDRFHGLSKPLASTKSIDCSTTRIPLDTIRGFAVFCAPLIFSSPLRSQQALKHDGRNHRIEEGQGRRSGDV
jgi:hypothetical protein